MVKKMVLRCQFGDGQRKTLDGLTSDSTVADLQDSIFKLTNVPPVRQRVKLGYPPKPLQLDQPETVLDASIVRSGDTLIVEDGKPMVPVFGGTVLEQNKPKLVRRVVPADNSCLFASLSLVLLGSESFADDMRHIAASCIEADPVTYNEVFLGKTNKEYCVWLTQKEHWGGAIELKVLSTYNCVEINVADIQSGRMDIYGEESGFEKRVFLLYDGIHYDPIIEEDKGLLTRTMFDTSDADMQVQALAIATEARESRQYTDLAGFSLRCLVCNTPLTGQTQAQEHAKSTGHMNFGEV